MKVLVPGGASYIGAYLVPQLLADGHYVTVYDTFTFGEAWLPRDNGHLEIVKADVRDQAAWRKVCKDKDAIIYLACISRESMCQKYEALAHEVNVECFGPDLEIAKSEGVKRFIYASSVAVYGSSDAPATENHPIRPTSIYGKHKAECEDLLWKAQSKDFSCVATRSASVCGYSPRMRLDLTINRMVHDAYRRGSITVEGGEQVRSHIHMNDISRFYRRLMDSEATGAFNIVAENQKVKDSAAMVSSIIDCDTVFTPRADDRSYSIDGHKAWSVLDYVPKLPISQAVYDLKTRFDMGQWKDSLTNPVYQNVINA